MNSASWTLAAPFKEQRYHRSPSESIANNYTPTVQDFKIKELARQLKRSHKGFNKTQVFVLITISVIQLFVGAMPSSCTKSLFNVLVLTLTV